MHKFSDIAVAVEYVFCAHDVQSCVPTTVLYVPEAHGKHTSPAPPVYPALHRQSVIATPGVLITIEFAGHAKHSCIEIELVFELYVVELQL